MFHSELFTSSIASGAGTFAQIVYPGTVHVLSQQNNGVQVSVELPNIMFAAGIGEHMATAHEICALQMREAGRTDFAAIRAVAAIGDEIDRKLALGRFDGSVGFARRNVIAFGVEFEVMDQRFHRRFHFGAARRHDLVVHGNDRP